MRRAQITLAIEATFVIVEANFLAQKIRVTGDGDVLPLPWTYPSVFSAGGALVIGLVGAAFVIATGAATKRSLVATAAIYLLGTAGLWSFHRLMVWIQGVGGHGLPGWF
jgi:hypothetical protein